jgi:hypothetical protein
MQFDLSSIAPYGILNTSVACHLKLLLSKSTEIGVVRLNGFEDVSIEAVENLASILSQDVQVDSSNKAVSYTYVAMDLSCLTERIHRAFKICRLFGSLSCCISRSEDKAIQDAFEVVSYMKAHLGKVLGVRPSFKIAGQEAKPYLLCPYQPIRTGWDRLPVDIWQHIGKYLPLGARLSLLQVHSHFQSPEIVSVLCTRDSDRIFSNVFTRAINSGASLIYNGVFRALLEKVKTLYLRKISLTTAILFQLQIQMPQLKRVDSDEDVESLAGCLSSFLHIGQRE